MKTYLPARLVKGVSWYINFHQFDPATGKRTRFRLSFDLNRIHNLRERMKLARAIVADINRKLPHGYPYSEEAEQIKRLQTPIVQAVRTALELKCRGARRATIHSYSSLVDQFTKYLREKAMDDMPVGSFTKTHAILFLDDIDSRGLSARTHNNYARTLRVLFNALLDRQIVAVNPWNGIKRVSEPSKKRRSITQEEAMAIVTAARRHDRPLYVAILLQYYCFLRPNEMRHIRIHHFDLMAGVIRIPGSIAKNKRDSIITIPDRIGPVLQEHIGRHPRHWFLFGKKGGMPGPDGPLGSNTMGDRHMRLVRSLYDRGALDDIEGVSYYSWKDTGARALVQAGVPIDEVMKQLRHADLSTTQIYISSLHRVNSRVKAFDGALI